MLTGIYNLQSLSLIVIGLLQSATLAANPILTGADPHAVVIDGKVWIYPTRSEGEFEDPLCCRHAGR